MWHLLSFFVDSSFADIQIIGLTNILGDPTANPVNKEKSKTPVKVDLYNDSQCGGTAWWSQVEASSVDSVHLQSNNPNFIGCIVITPQLDNGGDQAYPATPQQVQNISTNGIVQINQTVAPVYAGTKITTMGQYEVTFQSSPMAKRPKH